MFGSELIILHRSWKLVTPVFVALPCKLVRGRWFHHSYICPWICLSQIQQHNIKTIYKSSEARGGFLIYLFTFNIQQVQKAWKTAVSPLNTEMAPVLKCDAELYWLILKRHLGAAEKVVCCGLSGVAFACSRSVSVGFLWFLPTIHCVWGLRLTPRCIICSF